VTLKSRLQAVSSKTTANPRDLLKRFGLPENPFPSAAQSSNNPHLRSEADDLIDIKIETFVRDKVSQVIVIEGTQGVGKTNLLNYFERELTEALQVLDGYYVIRYLPDPEASFDGILRRLFQSLGEDHLVKLGEALATSNVKQEVLEQARGYETRIALRKLSDTEDKQEVASLLLDWFLGARVLNRHKFALGVQFRLDTVESKTSAFRDLVFCSSRAGILNGIFLLLDELEKQDGVLSPIYVVRYLSAMRAIIDTLPRHLFMMIAVTPDAFRRYSTYLPAFQSRLQDRIELGPMTQVNEALALARFYIDEARSKVEQAKEDAESSKFRAIVSEAQIGQIFQEQLQNAQRRGDVGPRQRDFLHALHVEAEKAIQNG
jgi:hypothetical protein